MNIALIIAGGRGMRMGQDIPKQFLTVYDKPVIAYTMEAFEKHPDIDVIAVVCVEGWESIFSAPTPSSTASPSSSTSSPAAKTARVPSATACSSWKSTMPRRTWC